MSEESTIHVLYLQQELILPEVAGNNRCWQFAKHWTDAGHRVTFVTGHHALPPDLQHASPSQYPSHFHRDGIDVHVVWNEYRQEMGFKRRLLSFVNFFLRARRVAMRIPEVDAVLAYSAPLSVGELGQQVARRLKKPFFFELADVWPDVPIGMGIIRAKWLQRLLVARTLKMYEASTRIFTFSEGMKGQVLSHGVPADKVMTIPNGINIPQVEIGSHKKERADGAPMRIFYAGTIGTVNDVGQLVRAVHRLEQKGRSDIECAIVGRGNESPKVESLAQELGTQCVKFVSKVPRQDLPALLASADVGVSTIGPHPVLEANSATKFYDYLSLGLPVVINHGGWQADYLRDNECGLSGELGDVEQLANNLERLADDSETRCRLGANAKRCAFRDFDRKDLARKMMAEMVGAVSGG